MQGHDCRVSSNWTNIIYHKKTIAGPTLAGTISLLGSISANQQQKEDTNVVI